MVVTIFFTVVILIPIYGLLIWTYNSPEESILFGSRWMYKEEPEISSKAIRYTRFIAMASMIAIPFAVVSLLLEIYVLRLVLVVIPIVMIFGALKIFTDEKDQ
ncbi:hypothetical protein J7I80_11395 [Bacillus sp. ISL-41]|uniref:hypothetical protein n=1 Tax=Bacillus sp. ISL-41 TaxID=2819127 RepID=UPI001BE70D28|nr:hypothetical protein [Bacillus sp. ISL-41]MBT2642834.1 hypothetical protein [Bacillus sp. ISL-41]